MAGQSPEDKVQAVGKNFLELLLHKVQHEQKHTKGSDEIEDDFTATLADSKRALLQPCCNTDIAKTCGCLRLKGIFTAAHLKCNEEEKRQIALFIFKLNYQRYRKDDKREGQRNCLQVPYKSTHIYQSCCTRKGSLSNEAKHQIVFLFIRQTNYTYFIKSANFSACPVPSGACIIYIPCTPIREENVLLLAQLLICNLSNLLLIAKRILCGKEAYTQYGSFLRVVSLNISFLHYSQFKQFIL